MGVCYLHIGMHKTGSTSIQRTLCKQWLEDADIIHAKIPSPRGNPFSNHTVPLGAVFSARIRKSNGVDESVIAHYQSALLEFLSKNKGKNVLFSAEGLPKLTRPQLVKLKKFLSPFFDDFLVVAYIRSPRLYMSSAFQQVAKSGAVDVSATLERVYPRYRQRFEKFLSVFGQQKVKLWKFDPKSFAGGCVVKDFAMRLGSNIDSGNVMRVNDGLSREVMVLIQIYFNYLVIKQKVSPQVSTKVALKVKNYFSGFGGDKIQIDPTRLEEVIDKNIEDIEWMEGALGESLDDTIALQVGQKESYISKDADLILINHSTLVHALEFIERKEKKKLGFVIDPNADEISQATELISWVIREKGFNNP